MKKLTSLLAIMAAWLAFSCDDSTDTLGYQMMPAYDMIQTFDTTYLASTKTVEAGNVLARTSISYLGQFTDPETYTSIKSDFLAQFHCNEGLEFGDSVVDHKITSTYLRLYISDYVGDSLQSLKLSVYPLDKIMNPEQNFYTDIDPTQYYDTTSAPLAEKWFTFSDRTLTDSARYALEGYEHIKIPLPDEVGQQLYDAYLKNPAYFHDTYSFIHSDIPCTKGFYFKLEAGDGLLVSIDICQMVLAYDFFDSNDSTVSTTNTIFASTEEVVQATRFDNLNLESLVKDTDATYLKSPAGLFTELTFPIEDFVKSSHANDSINSVNLTLTRYNDVVESSFKLNIPTKVLLVPEDEYYDGYFENYKLADGITSFLTSFSKTSNTYEFNNITPLINHMIADYKNPDRSDSYNKVLVIPVEATYDTSSNLVKLCHDFSMTSTRLVGGAKDKVKLNVVYSSYK